MNKQEIQQISSLISNFDENKKVVPYLYDLENYPVFWPLIKWLSDEDKTLINELIDEYIKEKISKSKTKWGLLFQRFFEIDEELFWTFRDLNDPIVFEKNQEEFQRIWALVETEMFKYEWILTDRMLKQEKGLDKVLESFYNIVYGFFPKYNLIS